MHRQLQRSLPSSSSSFCPLCSVKSFVGNCGFSCGKFQLHPVHVCVCVSDLPPSQGGRYAGFGNTVQPDNKDSDYWSSWSSVSH